MGRAYDVDGADVDGFSTEFRAEFLAMGSWDDCNCFGSMAGSESTLVIGASMSDDSLFDGTSIDVTYKMDAWAIHAAQTEADALNWDAMTPTEILYTIDILSHYDMVDATDATWMQPTWYRSHL